MFRMERRRLPGTDLVVSPICYGAGSFDPTAPTAGPDRLLKSYRDAGGNFLDTAHCYAFWLPGGAGCSERALADYVRRNGCGDLVIATKGGHPGAPGYRSVEHWLGPARIESDIDDSLGRLRVERLDLFWLHRDETDRPVAEIVETLNREVRRGRLRWLGASNWRSERIAEANAYAAAHGLAGFVASQPEFSLAVKNTSNPQPQDDASRGNVMLFLEAADQAWHRRTQLPVVPYTSTAGGYFASGGESGRTAFDNPGSRARLRRTEKLAAELDATAGQVALAWLLHQDFPVFPIIGTRNEDHLREYLGAAGVRLTPEQVRWLADGEGAGEGE
jgi:aryl-alcohol dehydrogenase-like predicted oxidoreductase